ncbi:MAG: ABC transporter substrate-binding protein, partial [Dehalococcoidia bacterium]
LDTNWQIGSGPYQLAEYDLNARYLYKRFPGYRDADKGLPYIEEREYAIIVDAAAQEAAFRSEQLHIWPGNPGFTVIDPLKKDLGAKIDVDEWLSLGMFSLSLNVTKPPWNDVRAREAVYRVVSRQQYLDLLEDGKGEVCPGALPVGLSDFSVDSKQTEKHWRPDPRAARQLLDAAGLPPDREVEMIISEGAKNSQGAQIFQQQLSQAGVTVRIVSMPFAEWRGSRVATGNWESWFSGNPAFDTPEVPLRMQHSETFTVQRFNGLKDAQVDAMIEKSEVTLDRNERIKLVQDIQIALLEKYTPYIQLYSQTVYQPRYTFVRDYENNPSTQPMYRTAMWLDR